MRSSTPPRHRNISSCRSSSMAYARTSSLLSKDATLCLQSQQTTQKSTSNASTPPLPYTSPNFRSLHLIDCCTLPKPCPRSVCCLRKLRYVLRKVAYTPAERICKEQQNTGSNNSNVQHRPSSHERPRSLPVLCTTYLSFLSSADRSFERADPGRPSSPTGLIGRLEPASPLPTHRERP
jgi:hypothetical protein